MNQNSRFSNKKLIIVVAALIGVTLVFLFSRDNSQTTDNGNRPSQAAITTNVAGENQGQSKVIYNGFGDLSKYGLTSFQMQGVRYALYQFAPGATTFTIAVQSIKTPPYNRDRPQPIIPITFNLQIDDEVYMAKVEKYNDLTTVRVYLNDPEAQNKQVYDSQAIDSRKLDAAQTAPGE